MQISFFFEKLMSRAKWQIAAGAGISLLFMMLRIIATAKVTYITMAWNLFLAVLPWLLSSHLLRSRSIGIFFQIKLFAWLMLVPNAFYLVTDLVHLYQRGGAPIWYDLAMLLLFAYTGLLIGVHSVRHIEVLIRRQYRNVNPILIVLPLMALNSLGIYLGRVLRFNSWDVVVNPANLFQEIFELFRHPVINRLDWYMIICYTLVLIFVYYSLTRRVTKH